MAHHHRKNGSGRAKTPGDALANMEKAVEAKVTTVAETVAKVAAAAEQAPAPKANRPRVVKAQVASVKTETPSVTAEAVITPAPIVAEPVALPTAPAVHVQTSEIINPIATVAPAAATAQKGTRDTMNQINEQMQQQAQAATEQFRNSIGDMSERTRSAMEKSTKIAEDMADLTRGNVEAVMASTKAAARGVETLAQETADYGRRSFEEASNTLKSFAEVRSATDLFKLQSDYARSAFEAYVAETAKVSEHVLKLAGEVAEPITSRYAVAAERAKAMVA